MPLKLRTFFVFNHHFFELVLGVDDFLLFRVYDGHELIQQILLHVVIDGHQAGVELLLLVDLHSAVCHTKSECT